MLLGQSSIEPQDEIFFQRLGIKAVILNRPLERIFAPRHSAPLHFSNSLNRPTLQGIAVEQTVALKPMLQLVVDIEQNLNILGCIKQLRFIQHWSAPVRCLLGLVEFAVEEDFADSSKAMSDLTGPSISENLRREHRAADVAAHVNVVLSEPTDVEHSIVRHPKAWCVAELFDLFPTFLDQIPSINQDDGLAGFASELEQPQTTTSGLEPCGLCVEGNCVGRVEEVQMIQPLVNFVGHSFSMVTCLVTRVTLRVETTRY